MGGRESAPGGAQSPRQLSREGSGGWTRNLVGVGVGVAELTQHNPPGTALPHPGNVLGPRPPQFCLMAALSGHPSPFPASARTSALLGCPCVWVWPLQQNKVVLGKEDPGGWSRGSPGAGPRVPKPPVPHPVTTGVSPPAPRGGHGREISPMRTPSHDKPTAGTHQAGVGRFGFFPTFILKVIIEA